MHLHLFLLSIVMCWDVSNIGGVIFLFIFSIVFTAIRKPPVVFFPAGDPNFIYAYIRMPIGTDQVVTDSITKIVEKRVANVVGKDNKIVKSIFKYGVLPCYRIVSP